MILKGPGAKEGKSMSFPIGFSDKGICYGLLYLAPWGRHMNFYESERGRNTGLSHIHRYYPECSTYIFEISFDEIVKRAIIAPNTKDSRRIKNLPEDILRKLKRL